VVQPRPQGAFPRQAKEKRPGDEVVCGSILLRDHFSCIHFGYAFWVIIYERFDCIIRSLVIRSSIYYREKELKLFKDFRDRLGGCHKQ